jgi:hypothetical protein
MVSVRRDVRITRDGGDRGETPQEATEATDEPTDESEEEPPTSIEDLTQETDPSRFDRTFLSSAADLDIEGQFDPVAGPKQVLPRMAYVINLNYVYNENRERWEPKKKGDIIDSFEDGDVAEYEQDPAQFTVTKAAGLTSERGVEGRGDVGGRSRTIVSLPGNGLPRYPQRGDTFEGFFRVTSGPEPNPIIYWGAQQVAHLPAGYQLDFRYATNTALLRRRDFPGGNATALATGSIQLPQDTVFFLEVDWGEPDITARIGRQNDPPALTLTASDSTFDTGGFALETNDRDRSTTIAQYDGFKLVT